MVGTRIGLGWAETMAEPDASERGEAFEMTLNGRFFDAGAADGAAGRCLGSFSLGRNALRDSSIRRKALATRGFWCGATSLSTIGSLFTAADPFVANGRLASVRCGGVTSEGVVTRCRIVF
jgi:hypothetical protein